MKRIMIAAVAFVGLGMTSAMAQDASISIRTGGYDSGPGYVHRERRVYTTSPTYTQRRVIVRRDNGLHRGWYHSRGWERDRELRTGSISRCKTVTVRRDDMVRTVRRCS